jgi:hypothetical protein
MGVKEEESTRKKGKWVRKGLGKERRNLRRERFWGGGFDKRKEGIRKVEK